MALILKATAATFTKFSDYFGAYPVTRGLVGAFYFGSAEENQLRNWAGGPDLTVVGSPTVNTNSVLVRRANGYNTGIPETSEFTWIAVVKKIAPTNIAPVISNWNADAGDADVGTTMGFSTGNINVGFVGTGSGATQFTSLTNAEITTGQAHILGLKYSPTTAVPFKAYGGTITYGAGNAVAARSVDTVWRIHVGYHNQSATYDFETEVYAVVIHNVALTTDEIIEAHAALQARMERIGITTL